MPVMPTPMERRLEKIIQRIEQDWARREDRLLTEMSSLKAQLDAQSSSIADLQNSLAALLALPALPR